MDRHIGVGRGAVARIGAGWILEEIDAADDEFARFKSYRGGDHGGAIGGADGIPVTLDNTEPLQGDVPHSPAQRIEDLMGDELPLGTPGLKCKDARAHRKQRSLLSGEDDVGCGELAPAPPAIIDAKQRVTAMTVKQGIERRIRSAIPEVLSVQAV